MLTVNGCKVSPTVFPDKTSQVWNLTAPMIDPAVANVRWDFEHEGEFMQLAQLRDLLSRFTGSAKLELRYLPYGRQDKHIKNTATFGLHTFARLLNALNFQSVIIWDPHSAVALELIERSSPRYFTEQTRQAVMTVRANVVCYPDAGAAAKYRAIHDFPCVTATKTRDQATGQITGLELAGDVQDKRVLIVDDICDGGATFVALAEVLRSRGAKHISLFVSHGIFSRGIAPLHKAGISHVYTPEGERYQ